MTPDFSIRAKVWRYPGKAAWYFISIPKHKTQEIKKTFGSMARGWGSLPVAVTVGSTTWHTSIFPDSKTDTYLLPVKAEIRKKEQLSPEKTVLFAIAILV